MLFDLSCARVFIKPGYTDLRKAVNGLTVMIQDEMELDPLSGNIFLFCNRERKLLKAVYWDRTGFWLCQKRLEKAKWPWPEDEKEAKEINAEEMKMLLSGIDFFKAHKELFFEKVS
jgi:transposase